MSDSRARQIITALVTALKEIDGQTPYTFSVHRNQVQGRGVMPNTIPQDMYPTIEVTHGGAQIRQEPSFNRSELSVRVRIFFANVQAQVDGFVENFLKDVEISLSQSQNLGMSFVHFVELKQISPDNSQSDGFQYRDMTFVVAYTYPYGSP